jgi:hypothetical protein
LAVLFTSLLIVAAFAAVAVGEASQGARSLSAYQRRSGKEAENALNLGWFGLHFVS